MQAKCNMAIESSSLSAVIPQSADSPQIAKGHQPTLRLCAFWAAFGIFGIVGIATSFACFLPAMVCKSRQARRVGQELIHQLFRFFLWYLDRCGLVVVEAGELALLSRATGTILVANHPSYLDAVIITAKMPNVCCIMKSSLAENPVLCGQSRLAGYVADRGGSGLMKTCVRRIQDGSNILMFPEGTRSGEGLGPLKCGFALLARMSQRPVQTIIVELMTPGFLGKGTPFFRVPSFPVRYHLRLGERFTVRPDSDARSLGKAVEDYLRAQVRAISPA